MANKQYSPGKVVEFSRETLVFEEDSNESYQVEKGTKGTIVEDKDIGEAGECRVEIEKEGRKKVIVRANNQNIAIA